jgi:hypothetical protein
VRFLVANDQILRGFDNGASFEGVVHLKRDACHDEVCGTVGMITSNLVFSKWDKIFKDPMTTMAAIDRLVHHATILEFDGESVRTKKAKSRQTA